MKPGPAIRFFAAIFLFLFSYNAHAYYYKQYTTSNGLISNRVYHSLRDRQGYLWFFTDKGVSKFDGATFKNYTVTEGLADHDIFGGYEDRSGRLWLYTFNGSPCYIKNDVVYNSDNDLLLKKLPSISFMEAIVENADSSLYIGYRYGQIIKVINNDFKWILNDNNIDDLSGMYKSKDTLILYNLNSWIYLLNDRIIAKRTTTENLNFHDFDRLLTIDDNGVKIYNENDLCWKFDDNYLKKGNILHVYYDNKDHFFCGTNNGLAIINIKKNKKFFLLENNKISSISQDLYGNYWLTTLENGIFYLNKNLDKIRILKEISNYKSYTTNDGQTFYIKGSNIFYFSGDSLKSITVHFRSHIEPVYIDSQHFIFTANLRTYVLNRQSGCITYAFRMLKHVYHLNDNKFLLIESGGAGLALLQNNKFNRYSGIYYPHIYQNCLADSNLFYSANNNLYDYDILTGSVTKKDSLTFHLSSISSIYYFNKEIIITTDGVNVAYYSMFSDSIRRVIKQYPFACYNIFKVNETGDKYIINTNKGYYIVDDIDNISKKMELIESPLTGQNILSLNIIKDKAIFNLNGNYYVLNDSLINNEKKKPVFFIEKKIINGQNYSTNNISIKNSGHTALSIELSHLKFDLPIVNYQYRIIQNDTGNWIFTPNNRLDIFLEKYGRYVIEIRAITENKIVSEPQLLTINIAPSFYYSFGFYSLIVFLLLLIIYLTIRRYNSRRVKLFQNELNYLQLEHRAINSLLNPHFIFNAINNIQNLININSKDNANNYLAILSKLIRQNIENLQFSFIPISKELNLVRNYIMLQNLRFDNRIALIIDDHSGDPDHIQVPPLLIHTFVENCVVHGFRKEINDFTITVEINLSIDDYLVIKIGDNGAGLKQKNNSPISDKLSLGIDFMRKRLSRISDFYNVTFSLEINNITTANATGTEVTIILYSKFKNESKPEKDLS